MNTSPKAVNSAQTEREAFEAACQKLASMPEESHEKLFGNDDLDTWWALWKEARAASPAPSSTSGEDAAEQADAPVAPTFDDLAKRFGLEEMLSDVGAYGYDRTAMRKIVRDFYDALIALPRASEQASKPTMLGKSSFKGELTDERLLFEKTVAAEYPDMPGHQIDFAWWLWQEARSKSSENQNG